MSAFSELLSPEIGEQEAAVLLGRVWISRSVPGLPQHRPAP